MTSQLVPDLDYGYLAHCVTHTFSSQLKVDISSGGTTLPV